MIRRMICLVTLLLTLHLPALGLVEEGASATFAGPGMSFRLTAPTGWVLDDESCAGPSETCVIRPPNVALWGDDGPVITCAVFDKTRDYQMEQVQEDLSRAEALPPLKTRDSGTARVLTFVGSPPRRVGRVAHIDTPQAVCRIELSAPDQATFDKAIPTFEMVVSSFRYYGPETGENLARQAIDGQLRGTAEVADRVSPPEGWELVPSKPGITVYQRTGQGTYGFIAVYSPKPSEGDTQADYEIAWRQLTGSGAPAPEPSSKLDDFGWQVRVGERTVVESGVTTLVAVFSGFGRYTAVTASYNDTSYRPEVEKFLEGNVQPAGVVSGGDWTFRDDGNYDSQPVNGVRMKTSLAARSYRFGKDSYSLEGTIGASTGAVITFQEQGTYSIRGNKMTLHGGGGTWTEDGADGRKTVRALPLWERTYTFRLVMVEGAIHGPYLVLEGVEENDLDGAYDSGFPKAFVYVLGFH